MSHFRLKIVPNKTCTLKFGYKPVALAGRKIELNILGSQPVAKARNMAAGDNGGGVAANGITVGAPPPAGNHPNARNRIRVDLQAADTNNLHLGPHVLTLVISNGSTVERTYRIPVTVIRGVVSYE